MAAPASSLITPSRARELAASWYFGELWGWSPREVPTPSASGTFIKAALVCANADGSLSEAERNWAIGRAALSGAPEPVLEELGQYPASDDIESLLVAAGPTSQLRRALIYIAIKAASADRDYHEDERRVIARAAATLGIHAAEVAALESIVEQEARLKEERVRLCFPNGNPLLLSQSGPPPSVGRSYEPISSARQLSSRWYYREAWGWQLDQFVFGSGRGAFLKALLVCVNGEGALADTERAWVIGFAAAAGAPEALLDELGVYTASDSLEHVVAQSASIDHGRPALVYLAMLAARSDQSYSVGERRAVRHAAATLGVGEEELQALKRLAAAEARLRTERVAYCLSPGAG